MGNCAAEANAEVVALKGRVGEMRSEVAQMQYGDGSSDGGLLGPRRDSRDFIVPLPRVPELGLELARLTRQFKEQETLVALLTQQLEQAKIIEAKDLPVVQVLDKAVPPERPSRPKLVLTLLIARVAGCFLAIFSAFSLEYVQGLRRRAASAKR